MVRSNWGRLLRLAHISYFFRRLILSTSHVFFHQPPILKNFRQLSSGGGICSIVKWEISWPLWTFLSFTLFQSQENEQKRDLLENFQRHVGIFVHVVVDFRLIQGSFRYEDVLRNETKFPISRCRWKRDLMSSACPLTRDNQLHTYASQIQKFKLKVFRLSMSLDRN